MTHTRNTILSWILFGKSSLYSIIYGIFEFLVVYKSNLLFNDTFLPYGNWLMMFAGLFIVSHYSSRTNHHPHHPFIEKVHAMIWVMVFKDIIYYVCKWTTVYNLNTNPYPVFPNFYQFYHVFKVSKMLFLSQPIECVPYFPKFYIINLGISIPYYTFLLTKHRYCARSWSYLTLPPFFAIPIGSILLRDPTLPKISITVVCMYSLTILYILISTLTERYKQHERREIREIVVRSKREMRSKREIVGESFPTIHNPMLFTPTGLNLPLP